MLIGGSIVGNRIEVNGNLLINPKKWKLALHHFHLLLKKTFLSGAVCEAHNGWAVGMLDDSMMVC